MSNLDPSPELRARHSVLMSRTDDLKRRVETELDKPLGIPENFLFSRWHEVMSSPARSAEQIDSLRQAAVDLGIDQFLEEWLQIKNDWAQWDRDYAASKGL